MLSGVRKQEGSRNVAAHVHPLVGGLEVVVYFNSVVGCLNTRLVQIQLPGVQFPPNGYQHLVEGQRHFLLSLGFDHKVLPIGKAQGLCFKKKTDAFGFQSLEENL